MHIHTMYRDPTNDYGAKLTSEVMRATAIAAALTLTVQTPAFAHEVDEYVQSALISLERDHLDVQIRLLPGADVFPQVFAGIDTNADGVISDAEKQAYAHSVLSDLTFSLNGQPRHGPNRITANSQC